MLLQTTKFPSAAAVDWSVKYVGSHFDRKNHHWALNFKHAPK